MCSVSHGRVGETGPIEQVSSMSSRAGCDRIRFAHQYDHSCESDVKYAKQQEYIGEGHNDALLVHEHEQLLQRHALRIRAWNPCRKTVERFDDRLAVSWRVAEETKDALVPNLILQPLVENAIKHGISRRPGSGEIAVEAAKHGSLLVITIRDDGAGFDPQKRPIAEGVGLTTTRARLEKFYGAGQSFHFVLRPNGTEAVIRLPFRVAVQE